MKLAVIGGPEVTTGFSLAGAASVRACTEIKEAADALKEYAYRENIGVILIEETYAVALRTDIGRLMQIRDPYPLIVTIPPYAGKRE